MTHVYQVLLSSALPINQLETKVSLKTICCLRLFVVVYLGYILPRRDFAWLVN